MLDIAAEFSALGVICKRVTEKVMISMNHYVQLTEVLASSGNMVFILGRDHSISYSDLNLLWVVPENSIT